MDTMPSDVTVGELAGWLATVAHLEPEQIGPVVIVIGLMDAGRSVAVIPPLAGPDEADWKLAAKLLAIGIEQAVEDL